jgi:hypothetical protein
VAACHGYGLIVAACLGWFLFGMPVQLSDSFGNMIQLDAGWAEMLRAQFTQEAYLRPLLWAELKLVYDAAGGNYVEWFRGVHVAQVFALVALYLCLVRPRTWTDAAVVPIGLAALIGGHTFQGAIVEAFPINTFLTILLCCLAAANLALAAHRWWIDALAVALFVVAALTVESGLLVWVIVAAAAIAGARGVSPKALGILTVLLVGYFVLRFSILDVGAPALDERSAGFGFRTLGTSELVARFGDNPAPFYAYNVAASMLSVLLAEPQSGVFEFVRDVVAGAPRVHAILTIAAVSLGSAVIATHVWRRRREWLARRLDRGDRIVFMFLAVLAANSVISYPYTKDVVMSPAGVFYAAALFIAVRHVVAEALLHARGRALGAAAALALVLAATWTARDVVAHVNVRVAALKVRTEWVDAQGWVARQGIALEPGDAQLLQYLRNDAIMKRAQDPPRALIEARFLDVD